MASFLSACRWSLCSARLGSSALKSFTCRTRSSFHASNSAVTCRTGRIVQHLCTWPDYILIAIINQSLQSFMMNNEIMRFYNSSQSWLFCFKVKNCLLMKSLLRKWLKHYLVFTSMVYCSKMRSCRKMSSLIFLSWKSSSMWPWASSSCCRTPSMWAIELVWGILLLLIAESLRNTQLMWVRVSLEPVQFAYFKGIFWVKFINNISVAFCELQTIILTPVCKIKLETRLH